VEEFLRLHNAEDKALITRSKHMGQYSGVVPELTPPDMHDVLDAFWSLPTDRRPTAIIVANDWSAIGMYEALSARGIDVPGQVSVIGFDNVVSVCCSLKPALTTYDIPIRLAAYTAAKLLLQLIDSPNRFISPGIQMISGQLILRDSVRRVVPDEQ
jgi:LacI family transcriptional regulator